MLGIGLATAFTASLTAIVQHDLKKIIAFSTCSQLGYMFSACVCNQHFIAFSHLLGHAFFKASLFLVAGSLIHITNDEQDIRQMGGNCQMLPTSYAISLCG